MRLLFSYTSEELELPGDMAYGVEEFYENEAKMAARLSNFISSFLQISDPDEVYSGKRIADKPLNEDQMIAEVVALLFGNSRILSAGIYWDRKKFPDRTYFAPYGYVDRPKEDRSTQKLKVEDLARLNSSGDYLNDNFSMLVSNERPNYHHYGSIIQILFRVLNCLKYFF